MAHDFEIHALAAFNDNYIWVLHNQTHAAVVDPGDAAPVIAYLEQRQLALSAILVTHHHHDHTDGIEALKACAGQIRVYGPADEGIAALTDPLQDAEHIEIAAPGLKFEVLGIPGHTRNHIAYYGRNPAGCNMVFCGDTMFGCGCGRIFEGTPPQMRQSLARLASLHGSTLLYSAHEYTEANIRFAAAVEPDNPALPAYRAAVARLRAAGQPSLPTTVAEQLAVNPFLRWDSPAVIAAASRRCGRALNQPDAVFAAIREWKNVF